MSATKPSLGIREAMKTCKANAAGLIESMDLGELYGEDEVCDENEEILTEAQRRVVKMIQNM
jgi:hypothetical protein